MFRFTTVSMRSIATRPFSSWYTVLFTRTLWIKTCMVRMHASDFNLYECFYNTDVNLFEEDLDDLYLAWWNAWVFLIIRNCYYIFNCHLFVILVRFLIPQPLAEATKKLLSRIMTTTPWTFKRAWWTKGQSVVTNPSRNEPNNEGDSKRSTIINTQLNKKTRPFACEQKLAHADLKPGQTKATESEESGGHCPPTRGDAARQAEECLS